MALPFSAVILLLLMTPLAFAKSQSDECEFIRAGVQTGSQFVIPAGRYTCNRPIILDRSHFKLSGDHQVVLRLADGSNAPVIVMGDAQTPPRPLQDIEVSNLTIDGNRTAQSIECWGGPCDSGGTSYIRNNGISVRGLTNGRIENVVVVGARSGGVVTERECFDLKINRLTAVDNHFDGFAGYQTTRSLISNSVLSRNQAAGISIDIDFHNNTFRNIQMENNGDVGIFMRDSNLNVFQSMQIHNSGNHGIFLAQVEDVHTCPVDNEFFNLNVSGSRGWGFLLNDSCAGNRLTGQAKFRNNQLGCIREGGNTKLDVEGSVLCEN